MLLLLWLKLLKGVHDYVENVPVGVYTFNAAIVILIKVTISQIEFRVMIISIFLSEIVIVSMVVVYIEGNRFIIQWRLLITVFLKSCLIICVKGVFLKDKTRSYHKV
jgi:hypothetical protein